MTYRLQNMMLAMLLALTTLLVGFGTLSQNPTSGGYQLFERVASGISADIQLASLENFAPPPETASEYANDTNRTGGLDRLPCCFVAGTPIKTENGYTSIEQLEVGDWVLAQDVETGDIIKQQVTDVHVRPISEIKTFYRLGVVAGEISEDLYVTGEHPFWVPSVSEWVTVDELVVGTELTNHSGDTVRVVAKDLQSELQQTYNITVEGYSSYFAGMTETLVHNCGEVVGRTPNGRPIHRSGDREFVQTPDGRYLDERQYSEAVSMTRPRPSNADLDEIVEYNYRRNATVGSGSTADAVRNEIRTGQPTGGAWHSQKVTNQIVAIQRWINRNPNASQRDIRAAENLIIDMEDALATPRP